MGEIPDFLIWSHKTLIFLLLVRRFNQNIRRNIKKGKEEAAQGETGSLNANEFHVTARTAQQVPTCGAGKSSRYSWPPPSMRCGPSS